MTDEKAWKVRCPICGRGPFRVKNSRPLVDFKFAVQRQRVCGACRRSNDTLEMLTEELTALSTTRDALDGVRRVLEKADEQFNEIKRRKL